MRCRGPLITLTRAAIWCHRVSEHSVYIVPNPHSNLSSGRVCIPVSPVSPVFHFEGRQGERGTWVFFPSNRSRELLGPAVQSPSLLATFSPPASCLGTFNIPSGATLFHIFRRAGRISRRARFRGKRGTRRHAGEHLQHLRSPSVASPWHSQTQLCLVCGLLTR